MERESSDQWVMRGHRSLDWDEVRDDLSQDREDGPPDSAAPVDFILYYGHGQISRFYGLADISAPYSGPPRLHMTDLKHVRHTLVNACESYPRSEQVLAIDLLQQIREEQRVHIREAATKMEVKVHDQNMQAQHKVQNDRLAELITDFERYNKHLSVRHRFTAYSFLAIAVSALGVVMDLIRGGVTITSPWPEVALAVSLGFLFMARLMPEGD